MPARQPIQIPSIEVLIPERGAKPEQRYARDTARLLIQRFGGNPAPLLLLTEQSLHDIEGFGGPKRIPFIRACLEEQGLRMRDFCEHAKDRAISLYGSIERTPVQALYIQYAQAGIATFTHYYDSPAVSLLARLAPDMTLGDLTAMSRQELLKYFDLHGLSLGATRVKQMASEIESRLSSWQLSFKTQSARTKVS